MRTHDPHDDREDLPQVPDRGVDVTMHIGTGKAGSSTIQFFLRDNRAELADLGVLYPRSLGIGRHSQLALSAKPAAEMMASPEWPRQKQSDPDELRRHVRRRLVAEITKAGLPHVLLSDEVIFGASTPTLRRLGRFLARIGRTLRLVVYLRRQDEHLVSRYQETVKVGSITRLEEWAAEDLSGFYDYRARLALHERIFGHDRLVVRRFEPSGFSGGSLLQDFLDATRIDARAQDLHRVEAQNRSLDAETVEFLRLLNMVRVGCEGARTGQIDNRQLVAWLAPASTGPTLTLPGSALDAIMVRWEGSNSAVAREFLSDRSGHLFREPRRSADTTTSQFLPPERLDHYLRLAQVPERLHQPLRRLVEAAAREAVTR